MNIRFRKATSLDADSLVPLLFDSGPEAFQYVFNTNKKSAIDFLKYSLQKKGGEFGYGCHTCVLDEERIIGIGAEFSGENTLSFLINNAWQIICFYKLSAIPVIRRGLQVEKVLVPPKKNVHYIAHLDILPEYRGKGVGSLLIHVFMDRATHLQRTSVELDVAVTNPDAKRLYKNFGFVVDHLKKSELRRNGVEVPSYERMILIRDKE